MATRWYIVAIMRPKRFQNQPSVTRRSAVWVVRSCAPVLLAVVAGCTQSPFGRWRVNTFEPSSARGRFEWTDVWLNRDGSFVLAGRCADQDVERRGTWSFSQGRMRLVTESGRERVYLAHLVDATHLKVYTELLGSDVVAVLKRVDDRADRKETTK